MDDKFTDETVDYVNEVAFLRPLAAISGLALFLLGLVLLVETPRNTASLGFAGVLMGSLVLYGYHLNTQHRDFEEEVLEQGRINQAEEFLEEEDGSNTDSRRFVELELENEEHLIGVDGDKGVLIEQDGYDDMLVRVDRVDNTKDLLEEEGGSDA